MCVSGARAFCDFRRRRNSHLPPSLSLLLPPPNNSKDSSVGGPGYLSALLRAVTYVDDAGALVTLSADGGDAERARLVEFTCSYGEEGERGVWVRVGV